MKIAAIIPAAGSGKRMGTDCKKQFLEIDGQEIIYLTIKKFIECDKIDLVVPIVPLDEIDYFNLNIVKKINSSKLSKPVIGGKERQDSVYNALNSGLFDYDDIILIHDGVRPFVSQELIESCAHLVRDNTGVITGVKPKDTVKKIKNNTVMETIDRDSLILVHTPQAFKFDLLKKSYDLAFANGYYGTDDSSIVEKFSDIEIKVVTSSYNNIKITTIEDLIIAKCML
ncbi:MAG: 2-C-methyl-D-erythritol 4-phosphate cytidylyltransferase [Candidatus Delongbacteria bacterium]|nr:2-C-methyl-D-erythritol 4-phosphate cytidylyltransferase [Candidatus Delongbacteria bacterium]MBN2836033.1 2-C-methyl-D-erythritol 4-phosphate cytidylyltransferase [Candidatus Delongbacteria bacterium]